MNGSDNGTLTHAILARDSPAVNFGKNCTSTLDQRGVMRYQTCDSGAYEFDGNTTADVPDCSPTGVIPLALDSAPGGTVVGLSYRVSGGPELQSDTGDSGQPLTPAAVTLPEGRATLEYWGRWTNGVQQGHGFRDVLVDKTRPTVEVESEDGESIFVITRRETRQRQRGRRAQRARPRSEREPESRSTPGGGERRPSPAPRPTCARTRRPTPSDYRVLAPGLGVRTVLERVSGRVRVPEGGGRGAREPEGPELLAADPAARAAGPLVRRREERHRAADHGADAPRGSDPGRPVLGGRLPGAPVAQGARAGDSPRCG